MRGLLIAPKKEPHVVVVPNDLNTLQELVGGFIETYSLDRKTVIVCNDAGKLIGLTPNRYILDEDGSMVDLIVGTFLVVGQGIEDFTDLTQEQVDHWYDYFALGTDTVA